MQADGRHLGPLPIRKTSSVRDQARPDIARQSWGFRWRSFPLNQRGNKRLSLKGNLDSRETGAEGGRRTLERYGKQHFADIAHKRWAKERLVASMRAQGLPDVLTDPVVLDRLADLLADRVVERINRGQPN